MEIQGDFLKDSTYDLASISFAGIKPKHHEKLIGMIDYNKPRQVTLTVQFFQEFLGAICQFDKYEISKVMIAGSQGEIQLLLVYKKIEPTGKSKN